MKLKSFQKQDLSRAALHHGLILSWDTGLGKTWAMFLWPLLKVGFHQAAIGLAPYSKPKPCARTFAPNARRLRPKAPVLIVAPGDLHQQIVDEAWERFGIVVYPLDSQDTFGRLTCSAVTGTSNLDAQGRPILEPDFYLTSYTQLTTNGVERLPKASDWENPDVLRQLLALSDGPHVPLSAVREYCQAREIEWPTWQRRPEFLTTCEFWAWRQILWHDEYAKFDTNAKDATQSIIEAEYERQLATLDQRLDQEQAEKDRVALLTRYETLQQLVTDQPDPRYSDLAPAQRNFVLRQFLADFCQRAAVNEGECQSYQKLTDGTWRKQIADKANPTADDPTVVATRRIKCVYSPSLSDLAYNAFRCVVVDEGVKMKGADTYVGAGVRQLDPEYRLVLTATPVKNRLPDLFWLAHWATGGRHQPHARFPYSSDPGQQNEFAETFMVSEEKLSKAAAEKAQNRKSSKRFKKLTPEVCNIHRLWKLLGPIILRRRKDDCNEDLVPKVRRVIRSKMGTLQSKVYAYHLQAEYLDVNGDEALGARLQSLRIAAADPTSLHLPDKPGGASEKCRCTQQPVPPDVQLKRLQDQRQKLVTDFAARTLDPGKKSVQLTEEYNQSLARLDAEIAAPIQRYDTIDPDKNCRICQGVGHLPLPPRSSQPFIPKHASVLNLVHEILQRGEQVLIGAAFTDPLDHLSHWLNQAGVRHLKLDGRTSQKTRGQLASQFKRGRYRLPDTGAPTSSAVSSSRRTADKVDASSACSYACMLAGVECMAEGHSFHLANNVILLAYSWAYDKFIQFINRVHRMTSPKPVNVYVVICDGTIDRRLESLVGEKGDSAELILDGRLIGERTEEINLAQLLNVAYEEFDGDDTLDETILQAQWPTLRGKLAAAQADWDRTAPVIELPAAPVTRRPANPPKPKPRMPAPSRPAPVITGGWHYDPVQGRYVEVIQTVTALPDLPPPPPEAPEPSPLCSGSDVPKSSAAQPSTRPADKVDASSACDWKANLRPKAMQPLFVASANPWDAL